MLAEIVDFAALEADVAQRHHLFAGFALVVDHPGSGQVDHFPSGVASTAAPVQLLGVHEERIIQGPYLLHGLTAEKDTGPGHPVHLGDGVVGPILYVVAAQDAVVGPPLLDNGALHEGRAQRGEAAA